jgi:hypothetical protein
MLTPGTILTVTSFSIRVSILTMEVGRLSKARGVAPRRGRGWTDWV